MIVELYAVRDAINTGFSRPFTQTNLEAAKRSFMKAVEGADPAISENPEDYTLYYLGKYNDESGFITAEDPSRVFTGLEALAASRARIERLDALQKEVDQLNGKGGQDSPHVVNYGE